MSMSKITKALPFLVTVVVLYYAVQHVDKVLILKLQNNLTSSKTAWQRVAIFFSFAFFILHPFLESVKWKILLSRIREVTLKQSWAMCMRGMSSTLMMPNRSGDFIGKLYGLDKKERVQAFALSGVGNFFQLLQTLIWGTLSMLWLGYKTSALTQLDFNLQPSWLFGALPIFIVLVVIVYIKRDKIQSHRFYNSLQKGVDTIKSLPREILFQLFILSALRYFIFVSQYYLLFFALGSELHFTEVAIAQSAVYFTLSFVPHTMIMDIALRAPLSLFFYSVFGADHGQVLLAAYSIYFLNILLPALSGLPYYKSMKAETQP